MWKTFTIEYRTLSEFDDFLNRITKEGWTPVLLREQTYFRNRLGQLVAGAWVTGCAVTAFKQVEAE
jgi:hypothetical protein